MKQTGKENIFEALGFDKLEAANMKIRAELLLEIREYIRDKKLKQKEAAALLGINQPEVSALMNGLIFKFSIDALVTMLAKLGHEFKITPRRRQKAA